MIQQESRLKVADNSGAVVRRSRTINTAWVHLLGAHLRGTGGTK